MRQEGTYRGEPAALPKDRSAETCPVPEWVRRTGVKLLALQEIQLPAHLTGP